MNQKTEFHEDSISEDMISRTWDTIDILLISSAIVCVFLIAMAGIRYLFGTDEAPEINLLSSSLLVLLEVFVLVGSVYLIGMRRHGYTFQSLGLIMPKTQWIVYGVLIGILAIPLSAFTAILVQLALDRPLENPQLPFIAPDGFSWMGAILMLLLAGIIAPFGEELYFRGVLYKWMGERWGIWPGIMLSSLIFGAVHGEISVSVAAFVLGIILAWVYERSGSLWISILIHAINNGVKVLVLYIFLGLDIPI